MTALAARSIEDFMMARIKCGELERKAPAG
jgi:hypothetical protein